MSGRRSSRNAALPVKSSPMEVTQKMTVKDEASVKEEAMDTTNAVNGVKKRKALPESFRDKSRKRPKLTPRHPCSILVDLGISLAEDPATGDAPNQEFKYSVKVDGYTLTGIGNSKQKAKETAARTAILHCIKTHNKEYKKLTERFNRGDGKSVVPTDEQVKQLMLTEEQLAEGSHMKNAVSILTELCRSDVPSYSLVSSGLGVNRKCVCQLKVGTHSFKAVGKTNAGAKVQAARVALASLYKIFVPAPEIEYQNQTTTLLRSTSDIFEEFLGCIPLYEIVKQNQMGEPPSCTIQLKLNDEVIKETAKCKGIARLKVAQAALARFYGISNVEPKSIRTNIKLLKTSHQVLAMQHDGFEEKMFEISADEEAGSYTAKLTIDDQVFTATVQRDGGKKGAKDEAARLALETIYQIAVPSELKVEVESKPVLHSSVIRGKKSAVMVLNETIKTPVSFSYEESDGPPFTAFAYVETKLFKQSGDSKKLAKDAVARKILNDVCNLNDQAIDQRMAGLSTLEILRSPVTKGVPDEQKSPVMLLNEKCGTNVGTCVFGENGPLPNKYTCEMVVQDRMFTGVGTSKKLAKADASTIALKQLFGIVHTPVVSPADVGIISSSGGGDKNPIQVLYNKAGQGSVSFHDIGEEGDPPNKMFSLAVTVGEKEFVGTGSSKKKAKAEACKKALEDLYNIHSDYSGVDGSESRSGPWSVTSIPTKPPKVSAIKSPISALNESDKDAKGVPIPHEFILVKEQGQTPSIVYVMKVVVQGKTFTGEGPSKQAAKQDAALKALKRLFPAAATCN